MTKREKVILTITGIAAIFAVLQYGGPALFRSGNAGTALATAVAPAGDMDVRQLTEMLSGQLSATELSEREERILALIADTVESDPFIERARTLRLRVESESVPAYTGFISIGGRRLAIIDGRDYQEGDSMPRTGYRILEITASAVRLGDANGVEVLVLTMEEDRE